MENREKFLKLKGSAGSIHRDSQFSIQTSLNIILHIILTGSSDQSCTKDSAALYGKGRCMSR